MRETIEKAVRSSCWGNFKRRRLFLFRAFRQNFYFVIKCVGLFFTVRSDFVYRRSHARARFPGAGATQWCARLPFPGAKNFCNLGMNGNETVMALFPILRHVRLYKSLAGFVGAFYDK